MKKSIAIIASLIMVLCFCACGDTEESGEAVEETTEATVVYFEENDATNSFMMEYNAITESEFTDISSLYQGVECHASSYGYYFIITAPDDGTFEVRIEQTSDVFDKGMDGMKQPFHDAAKALDGSLSDDDINTFYDSLQQEEHLSEGNSLGKLNVTYKPDIELSQGLSRGYVEINVEQ